MHRAISAVIRAWTAGFGGNDQSVLDGISFADIKLATLSKQFNRSY